MTNKIQNIPEFEGYHADTDGNVWSFRHKNKRKLKVNKYPKTNYLFVKLRKNKKQYCRSVHSLILRTFVGPRPDKMQCCHNDGKPHNNKLSNLRWDTPSNNQKDRIKHGTHQFGEKNASAKLNELQVRVIYYLSHNSNMLHREIAKLFNIRRSTVTKIKSKTRWSYILN